MVSIVAFIIPLIVIFILLILIIIFASLAVNNSYNSAAYPIQTKLQSAHTYLVWTAIIGGISFLLLLITMFLAIYANYYGSSFGVWIIMLLVLILLMSIAISVLSALAAEDIYNLPVKDSYADNAYLYSIISFISGIGVFFFTIMAMVVYFYVISDTVTQITNMAILSERSSVEMITLEPLPSRSNVLISEPVILEPVAKNVDLPDNPVTRTPPPPPPPRTPTPLPPPPPRTPTNLPSPRTLATLPPRTPTPLPSPPPRNLAPLPPRIPTPFLQSTQF